MDYDRHKMGNAVISAERRTDMVATAGLVRKEFVHYVERLHNDAQSSAAHQHE